MPPLVAAPTFSIRKPARQIFSLDDYVRTGVMSADQAEVLAGALRERCNILVAGPSSSGKITLVNALLAKVADSGDRVILSPLATLR